MKRSRSHIVDYAWNVWCIASIIGIWPRFVEPYLLTRSRITFHCPEQYASLDGLRILHFSDFHFHPTFPDLLLGKIRKAAEAFRPDIVVFTGDFITKGSLVDEARLLLFLNSFRAPYGCYAVVGNHDYEQPVGINHRGEYDIISEKEESSALFQGLKRLFSGVKPLGKHSPRVANLKPHAKLVALLEQTPFRLLYNESIRIPVGDAHVNISGLGEYMCAQALPEKALHTYDPNDLGIILLHNPDALPLLDSFPAGLVLSGHTHGGHVNLPLIWKKLTLIEKTQFKSGLFPIKQKWVYINRGIGSLFPFRWFTPPELLLLTFKA